MSRWSRINDFLNRLERALLVALLALMVVLAFLPILFRNLVSVGFFWIDLLLRHLVLWVTMLGASIATREGRHIRIDLVAPRLGPAGRAWLTAGIDLFSGIVCLSLILPAVAFVQMEYEVGKLLIWKIPLWFSQAVMPVMLAVIGLRFLFAALRTFRQRNQPETWESSPQR